MSRVTVIIPTYNGEKFIKKAVQSILNQTYQDFTLLIIDDGSSDTTIQQIVTIQDSRICLVQNKKNNGIAYSRNMGLTLANTEYIALLDHDDIAVPYRLEHEINFLDTHPEIDVVGGHQRYIDEHGTDLHKQWTVYLNPNYIKAYLLLNNTIVNGSTMFRKSFIEKYNLRFKDGYLGAEDFMFWVECATVGQIQNLDEVLLLWRVTKNQVTSSILREHTQERKQILGKIRKYSLELNQYCLTDKDYEILNEVFAEDGYLINTQEIERLYNVLKKIAIQAQKINVSNKKEVIAMCRKRFGEKIGKAFFLWE